MDCRKIEKIAGEQWRVKYFDIVSSTSTLLADMGDARQGQVIIAGRQTAGKGRLGRQFDSPAGSGLYMSLLLMPERLDTRVTLAVGLAAAVTLEELCGLNIQIKWPNDILCNGRKLGGILTESRLGERIRIIVGIGINLLQKERDFPQEIRHKAGSITMCGGNPVSIDQLAGKLLSNISLQLKNLQEDSSAVVEGCRQRLYGRGKEVSWEKGDKRGIITDISDDGLLVVNTGEEEISIGAGETSIQGLY